MLDLNRKIKEVTSLLLASLNARNKDIITRRFGLKSGEKETLESIGRSYSITRERVRQVEEVSLKQIRERLDSGIVSKLNPFVDLAGGLIEQVGGVIKEDELFYKFSGSSSSVPANAALTFFLTVTSKFQRFSETDSAHPFWALSGQHAGTLQKSLNSFISALGERQSVVNESQLIDFYKKSVPLLKDTSPAVILAQLSVSKEVGRNNFGEIGLVNWAEIRPRGVRDKAFLILKRESKPKHFREIAQLINLAKFSNKKANAQTVHNELIKDSRFVLVGRGTYGLSEWGLKAGTVKDVLIDILKSASGPMKKQELVAGVLSHRMVKETTVLINLQDSRTFHKKDDGTYLLREA